MSLYGGMVGEALRLVQEHQTVLDRLPRTFLVSILLELEKWPTLFEPERAYYRVLLKQLATFTGPESEKMFAGLASLESQSGCGQVKADDPKVVQERTLTLLRKAGVYSRWRQEVDGVFQNLQPILEAQLYPGDMENRLVIILYGKGIAIERDKLWTRFRGIGLRMPLELRGANQPESFLHALFTAGRHDAQEGSPRTLFQLLHESRKAAAPDAWVVEAGDVLQSLCEKSAEKGRQVDCATGMSYQRLRSYREQLTKALYDKVLSGVSGPLQLATYAKNLKVTPQEGVTMYSDDVVLAFIRDIFLSGNGTLILNNSFVEWASVQALKRAQPRLLVARFGVRDKMKPFSSLLLFSKPRPTDQVPILEDPLGSFIDVELLSYYIWLNAEKGPPYRKKTLYLLLAEGVDEILAVPPSPREPAPTSLPTATLPDVLATMVEWLGLSLQGSPGQVIRHLVS